MNRQNLSTWLPVMLWAMIIAAESNYGSAANTGWLLHKLFAWLFGHVDPLHFKVIHHILRKGGHFLGYGIFGYLWLRAFMRTFRGGRSSMWAALAVSIVFFIAALDEWHQSFSPGRSGRFEDVVLDTCGALVFVSLAVISATFRRKPIIAAK